MALLGGLIGKIVGLAVALVLLVLVVGTAMYASDYGAEANVTGKDCNANPPTVDVKTKLFGVKRTVDVERQQCFIIEQGNFVVFRIRSAHTTIYEFEGGKCIYDTKTGPACGTQSLSGFVS